MWRSTVLIWWLFTSRKLVLFEKIRWITLLQFSTVFYPVRYTSGKCTHGQRIYFPVIGGWERFFVIQDTVWIYYIWVDTELKYIAASKTQFYYMKSKNTGKKYIKEFKLDVVLQSYQRDNLSELARELGLQSKSIYQWRDIYEDKPN